MPNPERLRPSFTFTEDRLAELRAVVPEAFPDGELDWDTLREALGEYLPDDQQPQEHFGLSWPGKREARRLAAKPSHGTLIPAPGEGVNEETTENLFIEGDNLEVLKILQKSYAGRVKLIYIDPPYNTGTDFIYKDDYSEPLAAYLRRTNQSGAGDELLTTNPRSTGRYHSNWLNMLYPRLRLARSLLTADGLLMVSVDDNEVHHLRCILDEVFGAENFSAQLVWKCRKFPDSRAKTGVSTNHEYILLYARSEDSVLRGVSRDETKFSNPDNDPRGVWMSRSILGLASKEQRPNLHYPIVNPASGHVFSPPEDTGWRYAQPRMQALIDSGCILFPAKPDGRPREKKFRADLQSEFVAFGSIIDDVHTADGTAEIREAFGEEIFDFAKPTKLLERLIEQGAGRDGIVLDFFAGSGSTAAAVLALNERDGGNRKFILVQIAEKTTHPTFPTIAAIAKHRIRAVLANKRASQPTLPPQAARQGFRVIKLAPSNFKAWRDYEGSSLQEVRNLFSEQETPLAEDWTPEKLLTEVILLEGFPLDNRVTPSAELTANQVSIVSSEACGHRLWVCFDDTIRPETLAALTLPQGDIFICLDSALNDNAKLKLTQAGLLKTI